MRLGTILSIATFGLAALVSGCEYVSSTTADGGTKKTLEIVSPNKKENQDEIKLMGQVFSPPAFIGNSRKDRGSISVMVAMGDGKYVLGQGESSRNSKLTNAKVIIESEMNDGDNEPVTLYGKYKGKRFIIRCVEANGYKQCFY